MYACKPCPGLLQRQSVYLDKNFFVYVKFAIHLLQRPFEVSLLESNERGG